ncbi:hypothetical protein D6764_01485 [Candidatus Woesearchaeota archaeon]|nr:MAG: hypothetical protein D6764_01485 [Candidatus Woesearchaeota archaeon]
MMIGKRLLVIAVFILSIAATMSALSSNMPTGNSIRVFEWPSGDASERPSPADRIKEDQIKVYNDRIVIELEGARWAKFTDTNSMDPVIDKEANAIQVVPEDPDTIQEGDIISYEYDGRTIIHRVIRTGYDDNGWYAITKGDNIKEPDPEKVRFSQVKKIVVGILY